MSNGERAIPTFVNALFMVIGNVSIKVVDAIFPGLVLLKKWIGCMLCYCSQGEANIFSCERYSFYPASGNDDA